MAARNPVSSCTSRAAVTGATSPCSALPFGSDQSSYLGRCTRAIRRPSRRDGFHSTAPAALMTAAPSLATSDPAAQQLLLDVDAGTVRGRAGPTVRTEDPAAGVRRGGQVEQVGDPVGRALVLDLHQRLDPAIQIAVHHVRAADPVLLRRAAGLDRQGAVAEVEDPRVLQETTDNRADGDVLTQPGDAGAQRADPAHGDVDRHPGAGGPVEGVDDPLVHDRVHLQPDQAAAAGPLVLDLPLD